MIVENIIEICVAINIAILGIAYPIIIDKISNIGDKYSSEYIHVLFDSEFPQRGWTFRIFKRKFKLSIFQLSLFLTLLSLLLLIFPCEPFFGWDNEFVNNSADLIVFALTALLTIFFIIWLGRITLYNGQSKLLLRYLMEKYDREKNETELKGYCLKAINEMTYYTIEKNDKHLHETLMQFYTTLLISIRRNHDKSTSLIYPIDLYGLITNVARIAIVHKPENRILVYRAIDGSWLLGDAYENITVSNDTYSWLWRNAYLICDVPALVKSFWANSNNFFMLRFRVSNYDFQTKHNSSEAEKDQRLKEQDKFLEFHYALGGLLLYRKQFETLNYILEYSQSQPPSYVLLPNSMTEVFKWFEYFSDEFSHDTPLDMVYHFPELDNLGNSRQVNYWICCYLTALFMRQFVFYSRTKNETFISMPILPQSIIGLTRMLENTFYMERCLRDIFLMEEFIDVIGFKQVVEKRRPFLNFLKTLRIEIKEKIGKVKVAAELSEEKRNQFYTNSEKIILNAFKEYEMIFGSENGNYSNLQSTTSVVGEISLMSKAGFTDGDIQSLNYDTVFATAIAQFKIRRFIPEAFIRARTKRYLLNRENILAGLTKVIDSNKDILIVGVNLSGQLIAIFEQSRYKKFFKYIPSSDYDFRDTLFVLRRNHLPVIQHEEMNSNDVKEKQLKLINDEFKIYASVIDINKRDNEKVKLKWNIENASDEQDLKVQVSILFRSNIYWKTDSEIIQINIASEYREQGIQNGLNDIEPLQSREDSKA